MHRFMLTVNIRCSHKNQRAENFTMRISLGREIGTAKNSDTQLDVNLQVLKTLEMMKT